MAALSNSLLALPKKNAPSGAFFFDRTLALRVTQPKVVKQSVKFTLSKARRVVRWIE